MSIRDVGRRPRVPAWLPLVLCFIGCTDPFAATIQPNVPAFAPSQMGVIAGFDEGAGSGRGAFRLVDGARVLLSNSTRTVFLAGNQPGDLIAAGTDASGPWTAFATHVKESVPDCFQASGAAWNDGDTIVFSGWRFPKAVDFATAFPSTKRGQRYPSGDPCFNARWEVVRIGNP